MILTVTLNPAVDKTCETAELIKGQVNRMRSSFSVAGGKGVNVAKVLRQMDCPAAATGFLGGYSGRMIEDALAGLGVVCRFIHISGETRSSVNILADTGYVTEILEPGPVITEGEQQGFLREFMHILPEYELVVLAGSVPGGVPEDIYFTLTELCRKAGKKVFLDTSGPFLREGVKGRPYLIKPNRRELEFLSGRPLRSREDIAEEAGRLVEAGISKVIVSMGDKGLLYVDKGQTLYQPAMEVEAVNTVACGDTVVASLCMSELSGDTPGTALRKAAALSAANAATRESAVIPVEVYRGLL